jgi:hypothetical protein
MRPAACLGKLQLEILDTLKAVKNMLTEYLCEFHTYEIQRYISNTTFRETSFNKNVPACPLFL